MDHPWGLKATPLVAGILAVFCMRVWSQVQVPGRSPVDSEGPEALAVVAVEPHRWLKEAVARATFAGLESLDSGLVEHAHVTSDAGVQ